MTDGIHALDELDTAPLQLKIDQAIQDLSDQLASGHTDHFRHVMAFYAKFHYYSPANALLIMMQKPDAEVVAGYRRWQELGHQVRRNTKAAQIWCPVTRRLEDDEVDDGEGPRRVTGYRTGYVFSDKDLIDADTIELPSLRSRLPDYHQDLLGYIRERVMVSGVRIREVDHIQGAEGYYSRPNHEIVLERGIDSHNQVLVLLHEWAHALFHQQPQAASWPSKQKEFEAETVTMVMASMLGLSAPAASDYLLVNGVTPEQIKQSLGHLHQLVGTMAKHLGVISPVADPRPRDTRKAVSGRPECTAQPNAISAS